MIFHQLRNSLRRFATESTSSKNLRLTFSCPHQVILKSVPVDQVNLSSTEGDMGILANHVPSLLQLRPGLLEIFTDGPASQSGSKRTAYFVSGGFVTINPDSSMQISALEAVTLDKLDSQAVADGFAEAQRNIQSTANAPSTDISKIEAQIHVDVYQQLSNALMKK